MRLEAIHFVGATALLTDIAYMASGYALFSLLQTDQQMTLSPLPWLGMILVIYLINCFLKRRSLPVSSVIGGNLICGLLMMVIGCIFLTNAQGTMAYVFAALFFGGSVMRAYMVAQNGIKPNQMLIYTEFSTMLVAIFLSMETRGITLPPLCFGLLMTAICCDLISLVLMRVVTENRSKVAGSRYQGALLLIGVALLLALFVVGGLMVFSSAGRELFAFSVSAAGGLLLWLGKGILALINFLLSLVPMPEDGGELMAQEEVTLTPSENQQTELDYSGLLMILAIVGVIVVVGVVIWLLYRFRKLRTLRMTEPEVLQEGELVRTGGLWRSLCLWWQRQMGRLRFHWECIVYRHTPQGILLRIESWGKQAGQPRGVGESPAHYLRRVRGALFAPGEADNAIVALSQELERLFYSGQSQGLSSAEVRTLERTLNSCRLRQ
ncbi:MAG: hypothetical protein ACOX7F_03780 [Eubacteriales bacterium]|jgi:hypothetical protein